MKEQRKQRKKERGNKRVKMEVLNCRQNALRTKKKKKKKGELLSLAS